MENNDAPSPVLFFQTLTAYQRSSALKGAIDLDLFTAIGNEGGTATSKSRNVAKPIRAA